MYGGLPKYNLKTFRRFHKMIFVSEKLFEIIFVLLVPVKDFYESFCNFDQHCYKRQNE